MQQPRLFCSFSSADREAVRRFMARLREQPVDVWVYAEESEEIPGGDVLREHLQEKIADCSFFIPLISPHSIASPYTCFEVQYALERHAGGRIHIVPVVLDGCPPAPEWPDPYDRMAVLRYREMNPASMTSLESAIISLCADMRVHYEPMHWTDPRLPFMDRFMAELKDVVAQSRERDVAVYSRLMRILLQFEEAYGKGNHAAALTRINYFVACCETEYPTVRLYYPSIVKAIAELACGNLTQAKVTLACLQDHPVCDENFHGLSGYIHQQEGQHRVALECYLEAVRLCPCDPAARAGEALNSILAGEKIDVDTVFQQIDSGKIALSKDRNRVRALKARALFNADRLQEAEQEYATLVHNGLNEPSVLVNYAHVLMRQGRHRDARVLLERHRDTTTDVAFHHLLARLAAQTGDRRKALQLYAMLLRDNPDHRQYRAEASLIARAIGDDAQARGLALALLDRTVSSLPSTPDDFYWDGLANWLLGRRERAEYDFERSGRSIEEHYGRIVR